MIDLMRVFICPVHGEVLEDAIDVFHEHDFERDEVYDYALCTRISDFKQCRSRVEPKMVDGAPCYEKVDHERWLWWSGYYDDKEFDGEYDGPTLEDIGY